MRPVPARRDPVGVFEATREMGLVEEAAVRRDVRERAIRLGKQCGGTRQAAATQVITGRAVEEFAECAREVDRMHVG